MFKKDLPKFTYEEYRWAVATVMSRQNFVPIDGTPQICLIPFWDMLNHAQGTSEVCFLPSPLLSPFPRLFLFQITTFYNKEQSTTDCFAMADYLPGDQVFIYYGNRPNSMFLQYQGFIYKPNQNDCISLHFHLYVSLLSYSSSFYFFSSNTSTRHQLATRR